MRVSTNGDEMRVTSVALILSMMPLIINAWGPSPNFISQSVRMGWTGSSSPTALLAESLTVLKDSCTNGTSTKANRAIDESYMDDSKLFPHAFVAKQARPDFPILMDRTIGHGISPIPLVYLDSAATSQKPRAVTDAMQQFYEQTNSNVHRGAHTLSREATTAYEQARTTVADFVRASSRNEIVFTSGATDALNLVAQSYGRNFLQEGDEIILSEAEHHANIVPWQMLAEEKKLQIKYIAMDGVTGGIDVDAFRAALDSKKTKVVSFQHVSNVLGCINPVVDMIKMARELAASDCIVVLDACQSVPHMAINVQELGIDFLAASGHKCCGPTGIGWLWGREDLLNRMPPWKGGGEMIDQVTLEGSTYQPAPGRFEAGTPPIAEAIGLAAAIDYLNAIGMENIEAYEHEIGAYLYQCLSAIPGITVLGPSDPSKRAALAAFVHESIHPSDLSAFLDNDGVAIRTGHHCCQPLHHALGYSHSARASLYFYNNKRDVDLFIESLQRTIKLLTDLTTSSDDSVDGASPDSFVPFI